MAPNHKSITMYKLLCFILWLTALIKVEVSGFTHGLHSALRNAQPALRSCSHLEAKRRSRKKQKKDDESASNSKINSDESDSGLKKSVKVPMEAASVSSRSSGPVIMEVASGQNLGPTETADELPEPEEKMALEEAASSVPQEKTTMQATSVSNVSWETAFDTTMNTIGNTLVSRKAAAVGQGAALQGASQQMEAVRSKTFNSGVATITSRDRTFRPEQFIGGVKNIQVSAPKKISKPSTSMPVRPVATFSLRKVGDEISTSWQPSTRDVGDVSEARRIAVSMRKIERTDTGTGYATVSIDSPTGVSTIPATISKVGDQISNSWQPPVSDVGDVAEARRLVVSKATSNIGSVRSESANTAWQPSFQGQSPDAYVASTPRGVSSYYFGGASAGDTSSSQQNKPAQAKGAVNQPAVEADLDQPQQKPPEKHTTSSRSKRATATVWDPSCGGHTSDAQILSTPRGVSSYYFRGGSAGDTSSSQQNKPAEVKEANAPARKEESSLSRAAKAPEPWEPSFQGQSPDAYVASTPRGVSSYYFRGASSRGLSASQQNRPAEAMEASVRKEESSLSRTTKSPASWEPSFQGQSPDAYIASAPRGVSSYYFHGASSGDTFTSQQNKPPEAKEASLRSEWPSLSRTAKAPTSWEPSFQGQSPDAYAASAPRGVSSYYFHGASAGDTSKPVQAKEAVTRSGKAATPMSLNVNTQVGSSSAGLPVSQQPRDQQSSGTESKQTSAKRGDIVASWKPGVGSQVASSTAHERPSSPMTSGTEDQEQSTSSTGAGGKAATSWEPMVHSEAGSAAARSLRVIKNPISSDAPVQRVESTGMSRGGWTSAVAWTPKIRSQVASATTSIVSKSSTNGPRKSRLEATRVGRENEFEPWHPTVHSDQRSFSVSAASPAIRKGAATNETQRENGESSSNRGDNSARSWQPAINHSASPFVDNIVTMKRASTNRHQETNPESTRPTTGSKGNAAASWKPPIHEASTGSPFVDSVVASKAISRTEPAAPAKTTRKGTGEGLSSWQPKIHEEDGPFIDKVVAPKQSASSARQPDSAKSTKGSGAAAASWQPNIHENASSPFIDNVVASAKGSSGNTQPLSPEPTRVSGRKAFASWQPEIHQGAATGSPFVDQVAMKAASVGPMKARTRTGGGSIGSWQPPIHEEDGPFIGNVAASRKPGPSVSSESPATSTTRARTRANISSWEPPIHEGAATGSPFVDHVVSKSRSRSQPPSSRGAAPMDSTERHPEFNGDNVQAQQTDEPLSQQEQPLQTQERRTTGNIVPRNAPIASSSWNPPFQVHASDAHQLSVPRGSSSFVDPYFQKKPKTSGNEGAAAIVMSNAPGSDDDPDPEGSSKQYIDPYFQQVSSREDSFGGPQESEFDNDSD